MGRDAGLVRLLEETRAAGVELWTEGNRIRFKAPPGALSDQTKEALRSRRDEVIQLLRKDASESVTCAPIAANQHGLWLAYEVAPDSAAYNVAFTAVIVGTVEPAALEEALQLLVDRHESLRTAYQMAPNGDAERRTTRHMGFRLRVVDAAGRDEAGLRNDVQAAYREPFRLDAAPLLRGHLFSQRPDRHVFLLTAHHLAVDGQSLFVLVEELFDVYRALVEGLPIPSNGSAAPFSEFVSWQQEMLATDPGDSAYWKAVLDPPPSPLELPTDRPRPRTRRMRGKTVHVRIDDPVANALRDLARTEGTTEFVVLLSLWCVFLCRLTGATDVTVGTPVHGRASVRFERTVGDLINLIPVRLRFEPEISLRTLLGETREVVREGMGHQDFPLSMMEERRQSRERRGPPFETLLVFQDFRRFGDLATLMLAEDNSPRRVGSLTLAPYTINQQEGQFELALEVSRSGDSWVCACKYDTDLFEESTVRLRMAEFATLLAAAAAAPDAPVCDLNILPPEELALLAKWNQTEVDYATNQTLADLVESAVQRVPHAVAVVAEEGGVAEKLTYEDLDRYSNALAVRLQALGVGRDVCVAVSMERSAELVAALVAVVKSGGAYVPVDPGYPRERKAFMLRDCGASVVLTQSALLGGLEIPDATQTLSVDTLWSELNVDAAPRREAEPGTLAYVIYTSGSTGQPKGVMIEHRSIVNRLLWMQEHFGLESSDAVLQKTPYSFDVSVWEFFWPLMTGARLIMAKPDGQKDPHYLVDVMARENVTTVHFVPSMLPPFLEEVSRDAVPPLRRVICSGEALSPAVVHRFFEVFDGVELTNLYGPTEAAVDVSWWRCPADAPAARVPIGWPVANTTLHVLDERMQQVPLGVSGELHIGGVQVGRGYLGRPALTADRFVDDPFAQKGHLYRTGDRARFLSDGAVEYLGRLDHQVKVRGFRIEPGEIEVCLRAYAGVQDAVVVARDDRLVAYVVAVSEGPGADDLRAWVGETLPSHMVPSVFMTLDALPLTPSGKLDRKALPVPDAGALITAPYEAPVSDTEVALGRIWEEVLGVERVGRMDDFFRLGGHSLDATRIVSAVRERLGRDLSVREFFEANTLAALAATVDANAREYAGEEGLSDLPADEVGEDGTSPLTAAQERLWFVEQLQAGGAVANVPASIRLCGPLNRGALEAALRALVHTHDALRTVFELHEGVPFQRAVSRPVALDDVDLSHLRGASVDRTVTEYLDRIGNTPFDPAVNPPVRFTLLSLPDGTHVLAMTFHHLVCDGWSVGLVIRDLACAYGRAVQGKTPLLDPAPSYHEAARRRRSAFAARTEAQLPWWREILSPPPDPIDLVTAGHRSTQPAFEGASIPFVTPSDVASRIGELCRRRNMTPFMVFMAAFHVVLHRYTSLNRTVVGTPTANRTWAGSEDLVGLLMNPLPFQVRLDDSMRVGDLLEQVRDTAVGVLDHQDVPFDRLVRELETPREPGILPLFQQMLIFQTVPVEGVSFDGLTWDWLMPEGRSSTLGLDLILQVWRDGSGFGGVLEYRTDLFDVAFVADLARHIQHVVDVLTGDPDVAVHAIGLMPAPQRDRYLATLAGEEIVSDTADLVVRLQAVRRDHADSTAVVAIDQATGDRTALTYAALGVAAEEVKSGLETAGLRRGDVVAIALPRTAEAIATLIGVWEAGCVPLPLDTAQPASRLRAIIEDARPRVIVGAVDERLDGVDVPHVSVADLRAGVANIPESAPALRFAAGDAIPAYVLYTSGTTGTPKGVVVEQSGLVNAMMGWERVFGLVPGDVHLQMASFGFDVFFGDFVRALGTGGTLVICPRMWLSDPEELVRLVHQEGVTVAEFVPAVLRAVTQHLHSTNRRLDSVRLVACGSDAWFPADLSQFRAVLPAATRLFNTYGVTEATIDSTWYEASDVSADGDGLIPIGTPFPNVRCYVLTPDLQLCPPGVPGELCVAGEGVTRGYLGREDLMASRFPADPFREGARMYRTGDRARYDRNGTIELLGRLDDQVKVRGVRIELGEVEATLALHPSVGSAAVKRIVPPHDPDRAALAAYVVPVPGGQVDPVELRRFLDERLPPAMIPSTFTSLRAIPLNENGKVDRTSLPDPDPDDTAVAAMDVTVPSTETETLLVEIWTDFLQLDRPCGVHADFFQLGGYSILVPRLMWSIGERLGIELPVRTLYEAPTVAELARQVDAARLLAGDDLASPDAVESFEF